MTFFLEQSGHELGSGRWLDSAGFFSTLFFEDETGPSRTLVGRHDVDRNDERFETLQPKKLVQLDMTSPQLGNMIGVRT